MKGPILSLLVFYKEQQIAKPVDFVMDFCDMWNTTDYEPLKLYKGTMPITDITRELLQETLTFSEKDKPSKHKSLMLKTSLKRSRVEVHFRFEHPDMKRISDYNYLGWQVSASSIGIDIPFDNIKSNGNYTFDTLFQIFLRLLSYGTVENASVTLVSDIEFTTNVHEKIFAVISQDKGIIRKRRLDWATFFTAYEYQKILQGFVNANRPLETFCEQNGLEILMTNEFDGILLKVKKPIDDTPDYFCAMLKRTQEFYSILETNGYCVFKNCSPAANGNGI